MKARLERFMYGRYGQDDLTRFLSVFVLILYFVAIFTKWTILNSLATEARKPRLSPYKRGNYRFFQ
jgi:uncharacterized membrane protein